MDVEEDKMPVEGCPEISGVAQAGAGKVTLKDFTLVSVLGTGAFAKVLLVRKIGSG